MAGNRPNGKIQKLEQKGWQQLEHDELDQALATFSHILELDDSNEAGFQGKAAALRKKQIYPKAFEVVQEGLISLPNSIGILSELAWLHISQNNYAAAVEAFDQILDINTPDLSHFLWKTFLLRKQGKYKEAVDCLSMAERFFPDDKRVANEWGWLFFAKGMYKDALYAFERSLIHDPLDQTGLQGNLAALRKLGMYQDAHDLIQRLPDNLVNNISIQNELGWLYFEEGKYDEASATFYDLISRQPDNPYSYINLVWVLIRREKKTDLVDAAALCRKAIALDPKCFQAYGALGVIAFKQDQLHESEAYLLHSIQLDTENGYYVDLGALYIKMGRFEEAEKYLKIALHFLPQDPYIHNQLGHLLLATDRTSESIQSFRQAVTFDPKQAEYHRSYAVALIENDKHLEAEAALTRGLRQVNGKERWQLHLTLSQLFTRMGNVSNDPLLYRRALEEIKLAINLNRKDPDINFQHGIVRFKLNDYQGALTSFQQCRREKKDHLEADLNARRIESLIKQERSNERTSRPERLALGIILLAQLMGLWYLFLILGRITETAILVLVPLLLGLLIVSMMLPWLNRIKLSGLEAEMSEPKTKESLDLGPKGSFIMGSDFINHDRLL
jgi:tetratricopeptide (TPR) repeat protein